MLRRYVAPVLRLVLFLFILALPILLAAIAHSAEPPGGGSSLVTLRSVVLTQTPKSAGKETRLPPSAPATLVERGDGRLLVDAPTEAGTFRGWAQATAFLVLDDPALSLERLLDEARLLLAQGDRPVLAVAFLKEALRRDAARVEAWRLLGAAGERLAAMSRPAEGGGLPLPLRLAERWGVRVVAIAAGYRYDGEAYRRIIALSPSAEAGEEARLRLLGKCGPVVDPRHPLDLQAAAARERDLAEFLASYPASPRRIPLLVERARLLFALAEEKARRGDAAGAEASREGAIEAASEISSAAAEPARRREADRMIARLTRSFPKRTVSEKPAVSPAGLRAAFVARGGQVVLEVTRADGKPAIQPYAVTRPDAATLAFDPTGARLVWEDVPAPGRRRTRLLDLTRARLVEPAAAGEPEILTAAGSAPAPDREGVDRYTSFLGFSPDGRYLLIVFEGFTPEGLRIPRRHLLCDSEGRRAPLLVDRPFRAPGAIDWERLAASAEKLSG